MKKLIVLLSVAVLLTACGKKDEKPNADSAKSGLSKMVDDVKKGADKTAADAKAKADKEAADAKAKADKEAADAKKDAGDALKKIGG